MLLDVTTSLQKIWRLREQEKQYYMPAKYRMWENLEDKMVQFIYPKYSIERRWGSSIDQNNLKRHINQINDMGVLFLSSQIQNKI